MTATPKNESPFEVAKKNLHVKHIYLQKSETKTAENLDRQQLATESHLCQYFNTCDRLSYFITESNDNEDRLNHWYKFSYSAGVRMLKEDLPDEKLTDEDVLVEVLATFDVFYASEIEIPTDATEAFASQNVQYHVWPFWREFVHSVCGRIGLTPPIEIPSYIITKRTQKEAS